MIFSFGPLAAGRARLEHCGGRLRDQPRAVAVGDLGGRPAAFNRRSNRATADAGGRGVSRGCGCCWPGCPGPTRWIAIIVLIGLISGHPAGPIVSLPARVLAPETRAIGMGVFYTLFYAAMMLGTGGWQEGSPNRPGLPRVALDLGAPGRARLPRR